MIDQILRILTLAIDAMGGDYGPAVTVPAALQALSSHLQLVIFLVGDPAIISAFLTKTHSSVLHRIQVIPSQSFIESNAKPLQAIRSSQGSSLRIALELLKEGKVQACISAGNTGALVSLAKFLLKPLKGIIRPALMIILPHDKQGETVVLDLGANVNSESEVLVQFAIMGSIIAEEMLGISYPRIALLNIGKEEIKGSKTIRNTAYMLKKLSQINYIGYLEGNDLLTGKTDVLVCDGFIGNIMLKTMEGVIKIFLSFPKSSKKRKKIHCWSRLQELLMQDLFTKRFDHMDPKYYNGAYLLGLRGMVIKSHGSADQNAFALAIEQAEYLVKINILERISRRLDTLLSRSDKA